MEEYKMNYELLPIGKVVELKNSTIPVMIAGYLSVSKGNPDKLWDYSGFIFPIGYASDDEIYSFDHEQIDAVIMAIERGTFVHIENMDAKTVPVEESEYGFKVR